MRTQKMEKMGKEMRRDESKGNKERIQGDKERRWSKEKRESEEKTGERIRR